MVSILPWQRCSTWYGDPREEHALKSAGVWTGNPFGRLRVQHLRMKDKWLDRLAAK